MTAIKTLAPDAPAEECGRLAVSVGTPTRFMADLAALCSRYDATIKATCFGGVNIVLRTPEGDEYIDLTYHVDEAFPKADGVVTMDGGA